MANFFYFNNNPVSLLVCVHPKYFGEFSQLFGISGSILPPRMWYAFLKFGSTFKCVPFERFCVRLQIYLCFLAVCFQAHYERPRWVAWVGGRWLHTPTAQRVCRVYRWPLPTHIINSSSHDDDETSRTSTIA